MNTIVVYLSMFLIILDIHKDSLSYKWNLIGWTCTSYESILNLFFLSILLVNIDNIIDLLLVLNIVMYFYVLH